MQYITARGALIHQSKLTKGDFIVINAASSSVGIAAIEIARAQGAISIVTTRTAKQKAELLAVGADHVIVTDEENLPERVSEITGAWGRSTITQPRVRRGLLSAGRCC
jgi:NADPH:quinone reductase-like Zn-dependent oxidoreductase